METRFEKAAQEIIDLKSQLPLNNIFNRNDEPASWNDTYWKMRSTDGIYVLLPLHNIEANIKNRSNLPPEALYPDIYRHLLMCYLLDLRNEIGSTTEILRVYAKATRHLFAILDILSITQAGLNSLYDSHSKKHWYTRVFRFIDWCQQHGIIWKSLKTIKIKRDEDKICASNVIDSRKEKMPDERALWALCAIRNELIPSKVKNGIYHPILRDHFIVSSATLGLGSPQRVAAEQYVLPKQTLKSMFVSFKGVEQEVHWLDWQGSKGYSANKKHFFDTIAKHIDEVLKFWCEAGEPARILCRYYENQTQPLSKLLGDYRPQNISDFEMSKPVNNIFVLGYLLGFYEKDQKIRVIIPDCKGYRKKCIQDLVDGDKLSHFSRDFYVLFQVVFKRSRKNRVDNDVINFYSHIKRKISVKELQNAWIYYIKKKVPSFPYRVVGDNKVHLQDALFISTGAQMRVDNTNHYHASYHAGGSLYAIESVSLDRVLGKSLRKQKGQRQNTIFEEYGFTSDISVTPIQFRHWLNTKLQESMISDDVIAMLSGRVDTNQNAVYDHSNDSDKIARVSSLFLKEKTDEEMRKKVRIIGLQEYREATGKMASKTATGICTQDLAVSPCVYLNDFISQCTLCQISCQFAHDKKAIDILEKDLEIQKIRLKRVIGDDFLTNNYILQSWYTTHHTNVFLLEQLIELMKRDDIDVGTAIRYIKNKNIFRITDLNKRKIEDISITLPDSKASLTHILESKKQHVDDSCSSELINLLSDFGITSEI